MQENKKKKYYPIGFLHLIGSIGIIFYLGEHLESNNVFMTGADGYIEATSVAIYLSGWPITLFMLGELRAFVSFFVELLNPEWNIYLIPLISFLGVAISTTTGTLIDALIHQIKRNYDSRSSLKRP